MLGQILVFPLTKTVAVNAVLPLPGSKWEDAVKRSTWNMQWQLK